MAAKTKFRGSFTALVTPFKNGSLDEAAFRSLVNWQISEGTNGLVPVGTTGESPTLSHDEHKKVVEWCIAEAKGRVPVIAGAGSNSTKEAVELSQHAEKAGADAVLVVTPYYNKPTQEGMYQHFKAINDAIGIPIIIYNIPPRSVIDMSVDTMKRLWELKNIAGVKDATASMVRVSQQRAAMGEDFNQLSGEEPTLRRGRHHHRLHGAWRPRLHLGDLERRAAPVLGVSRRLAEGRHQGGAGDPRQADAAAQQPLHREQSGTDQVCDVAARQAGRDAALADGAGQRADARCGAQRHGARWADQLMG
jgi:4-hydroxy-tetrahydrodipicolinate synthase